MVEIIQPVKRLQMVRKSLTYMKPEDAWNYR